MSLAYIHGYEAYKFRSKCPYDECSVEEGEWYMGWYDAFYDIETEMWEDTL